MVLGDIEVFPLLDGMFRLDGGAMFGIVPKPLWERNHPSDSKNRILLAVRAFLIKMHGKIFLIDTGLGDKIDSEKKDFFGIEKMDGIKGSLNTLNIKPCDVDYVILSHLHFDHCGGATFVENGRLTPTFLNAKHFVQRNEWEDATHLNERTKGSYNEDDYLLLEEKNLLEFLDGDSEIFPGVEVFVTGGHTRAHQAVLLKSNDRKVVFLSDLVPTTTHLSLACIMGIDLYPMETLEMKRKILKQAFEEKWIVGFGHDPHTEISMLKEDRGRYKPEII